MLMGITPLVTMNTVYASSSNVIISKTSIVNVSKTTYLLDQNGKKLPVMMSKGEKIKVTAILNIGKKTLYQINNSNYWINSTNTNGKVSYKNYGTNYTIETSNNRNNVRPKAQTYITNIKLEKNAYLYDALGKKLNNAYIVKGTTLTNYGTKTINGKTYYNIGNGSYINNKNVTNQTQSAKQNANEKIGRSKNWQVDKNTLKLKKNAIPYDKNGKKHMDLSYTYIKRNTVLNYYGTKIINGNTYYNVGDGVYINSANVGSTSQN